MIPVVQTKFYPVGNCFDACLASVLEVPLDTLPHFHGEGWYDVYEAWLQSRGFELDRMPSEPIPPGYQLAVVESPRGAFLHSVVMLDGVLVWDPSPDRHMGIGEIVGWDILTPSASSTGADL